jgi:hypothetical protein
LNGDAIDRHLRRGRNARALICKQALSAWKGPVLLHVFQRPEHRNVKTRWIRCNAATADDPPYFGGGAGVKTSRLRPGSGLGLGFGAFLVSLRPLSLLPMAASMTQKTARREEPGIENDKTLQIEATRPDNHASAANLGLNSAKFG